MSDSRLSGFYRLPVTDRIGVLERDGWLAPEDAKRLRDGAHVIQMRAADRMIENVIATFGLPLAIAPNFVVDGRDRIVPLVVEEPSIVAALSASARLARTAGGFSTECRESLLIGQVHLTGVDATDDALSAIIREKSALLAAANEVHPRLVARGGGVRDIEVRELVLDDGTRTLAVHLLVDTRDAMGANLVNSVCEAIAPRIAELCNANVAMRILSNLADRSLVTARVRYPLSALAETASRGARVRDAIVLASDIARADPYRAATHNKGIMNGIDPLAIATGNDWRAIEAGAHAWAAADGRYSALTRWSVADDGSLAGVITLPLKVGTVGGTLELNPAAVIGLRIAGVSSATDLARLMAAVGLAQNFSAIRALVTSGIQQGHMKLHARSVAAAAEVPDDLYDDVVAEMIASGDVKRWKAREILGSRRDTRRATVGAGAAGKVILLGEHAVVYDRHALALPIPDAMHASADDSDTTFLSIPAWGVSEPVDGESLLGRAVQLIAGQLGISDRSFHLTVSSSIPAGMGLGASATFAVCTARALAAKFGVAVDDERVNAIAFECEKLAHGTPSGIDNTIATYARPLLFRRGANGGLQELQLVETPPVVIAFGNSTGSTYEQVAAVRERRDATPAEIDAIFDQIDTMARQAAVLLAGKDYRATGHLMNLCHGYLNAIGVSTPELERMVSTARNAGAAGAKLTGGGGGGSIVALCPGRRDAVQQALESGGFKTIAL